MRWQEADETVGTGQGLGEQSCSGAGEPFGSLKGQTAECHLWLRLKDNSTVQPHSLQEAKGPQTEAPEEAQWSCLLGGGEGTSRKEGKDARGRRS